MKIEVQAQRLGQSSVFDDTKNDANDPHVTVQGPKEYASLKNLNGRDWNNGIQSVLVGLGAMVLAYKDKDFKGTEIAFTSGQRIPKAHC